MHMCTQCKTEKPNSQTETETEREGRPRESRRDETPKHSDKHTPTGVYPSTQDNGLSHAAANLATRCQARDLSRPNTRPAS